MAPRLETSVPASLDDLREILSRGRLLTDSLPCQLGIEKCALGLIPPVPLESEGARGDFNFLLGMENRWQTQRIGHPS